MKKRRAVPPTSWLPEGFSEIERVEDRVVVDGLSLGRVGVAVRGAGAEAVTGSAAALGAPPVARAQYEALERLATLEAIHTQPNSYTVRDRAGRAVGLLPRAVVFPESDDPGTWRYARSSGVALHDHWATACDRAWWELVERDRVLRAWHGDATPHRVEADLSRVGLVEATSYHWRVARFVEHEPTAGSIEVVGVFGFPAAPSSPMVVGYAARPDLEAAVDAAAGEALQQLAFLWGEEIPITRPAPGPTAVDHVEALLWPGSHGAIAAWLTDGHRAHRPQGGPAPLRSPDGFVDLTPAWLRGRACVVRAIAAAAIPLVFGESPSTRHLPPALRVHPMP